MASSTFAATTEGSIVPIGFMPVRTIPGMTTLVPTEAPSALSSARRTSVRPSTPCFATVYGAELLERHDGRHGRHVHDVALLAGGQDARHEGSHAVDHAPEVDVDHPVPLVERDLPREAAVHYARVVHRHVEGPEVLGGGAAHTIDGVRVANIGTDREDVSAAGAQPLGLPVEPALVHVRHDHVHALGDEGLRDGQADPAGGARHHGDPVTQFLHGVILAFRFPGVVAGGKRAPNGGSTRRA